MRIFAFILLAVLALLQLRLWVSGEGIREVRRLDTAAQAQKQENDRLRARNDQLAAEVKDLKEGLDAVEERARSELGMIGSNETFYQVIPTPTVQEPPSGAIEEPARPSRQASSQ